MRVIEVPTGKTDARGKPEVLLLATDRMDLDAELVAWGDRFRWSVELFFRCCKCLLGCQHLLRTSRNGLTIQGYRAVIASWLVSLGTGRQPTQRPFEMRCLHFSGWASEDELRRHIEKLHEPRACALRSLRGAGARRLMLRAERVCPSPPPQSVTTKQSLEDGPFAVATSNCNSRAEHYCLTPDCWPVLLGKMALWPVRAAQR